MSINEFSQAELERYNRQMIINGWGLEGQLKLKRANVMIVGAGGLGCPVALYLTAAGVNHIAIVDRESVDLSNLNRQVLYWSRDIGELKVTSIARKLRELNPHIRIEAIQKEVTEENVRELIDDFDVIVDCLDNWSTRFLLNRACVDLRKPLIHAGVQSWYGQITTIMPGKGPCLRCLWLKTPPEKEKFPILGATAGTLGLLEAVETIKILTGLGQPLVGRMLYVDLENCTIEELKIERSKDCPVCGSI